MTIFRIRCYKKISLKTVLCGYLFYFFLALDIRGLKNFLKCMFRLVLSFRYNNCIFTYFLSSLDYLVSSVTSSHHKGKKHLYKKNLNNINFYLIFLEVLHFVTWNLFIFLKKIIEIYNKIIWSKFLT